MKLKGSVKNINTRSLITVTGIVTVLFIALRFYQLTSLTDVATGFFTDKSNFTVPLFYICGIGFVIVVCILSFLSKNKQIPQNVTKNIPFAVASILFAACLAYDAVLQISELVSSYGNYYGSFSSFIKETGTLSALSPVLALLSVAVLLINGICFFTGSSFITRMKLCLLIPVFWAFSQTIGFFSITASYLQVTQLLLTIFGYVFFMLFLFEYARHISGIGAKESSWALVATALVSAFLLLSVSLPNLIFKFFFNSEHIVEVCPNYSYTVFAGLFAIFSLLPAVATKKEIPVTGFTSPTQN